MTKRQQLAFLLFALSLLAMGRVDAGPSPGFDYGQVYIFGDSLSDTGNLASVNGDFPPPYYMNRVSNGPVAVDALAAKLGLDAQASLYLIGAEQGGNYAVAGARANGEAPIDLRAQVLSFQANHGYQAPGDALYVMFIGGNDVRDARDESDPILAWQTVRAAAVAVREAMSMLAASGAKKFLVINTPDIGLIPETRLLAAATEDPSIIVRAHWMSSLYRFALHQEVRKLRRHHHIELAEFDLLKRFTQLIRHADKLGFSHTTEPCFYLQTQQFHPDCNYGLNADQFIFFDEIHPTTRVHGMIGEAFFETLHQVRRRPVFKH